MNTIYNLILTDVYLYICIMIGLVILAAILFIVISNQKNRKKIKDDFVEAEKIEMELEKEEERKEPSELEKILEKMQQDIELKPEDVVKKFEEEQEQQAIISYQELVDSVNSGKIEVLEDEEADVNFVEKLNIELEESEKEPISDSIITKDQVKEAILNISTNSIKEEPKKFKQSEVISPVYGVIDTKLEYPTLKKPEMTLDIMNTKDYQALTEEIKKQEEFLQALIEFRNNL